MLVAICFAFGVCDCVDGVVCVAVLTVVICGRVTFWFFLGLRGWHDFCFVLWVVA